MTDIRHIVCPGCGRTNRVPSQRLDDGPKCGECKQPLFGSKPVTLDEASFDREIRESDIPVLVDFWAPWCGPCRAMAPAYEQAAGELEPRVRVAKVNTEENQGLAARFGIQSIPTLALFQGGEEVARQPGAMGLPQILDWVRAHQH